MYPFTVTRVNKYVAYCSSLKHLFFLCDISMFLSRALRKNTLQNGRSRLKFNVSTSDNGQMGEFADLHNKLCKNVEKKRKPY